MSQSRTRGTSAVRKSVTKASGDGRKEGKPHSQDKDKSTIPKNVRYELENALLGLCDVWFEEIKPHLVRNNIKLHVHGRADAGDGTRGAPACRHRDPGAHSHGRPRSNASSAGCCSARPPASTAPCRSRSPAPAPPSQEPLLLVKQTRPTSPAKPTVRRKRPPQAVVDGGGVGCGPQPTSTQPVPRPCRQYQPPAVASAADRTAASSPPPHQDIPRLYGITEISVTKSNRNIIKMNKACSKTRKNTSMSSPTQKVKAPPNTKRRSGCQSTSRSGSTMKTGPKHSRHKASNKRRPKKKREKKDSSLLFPDDLVEMIGSAQEQRLIMLYESPKDEYSLGLHQNEDTGRRYQPLYIRRPPWR
ncbi:serine/arginine repetitive matrix protein 1 isoform X1 [Plutella xylostella]|uniref:serine/arginine repetitive matrix protein 1 isoform X1 n=1 Tax=Plutella xylostella TaxID=51655 RepID=UPI0020328D28|nr:serine/arginine repetitive matrix protein 1 isoform X1 [Plutella xylostella]